MVVGRKGQVVVGVHMGEVWEQGVLRIWVRLVGTVSPLQEVGMQVRGR